MKTMRVPTTQHILIAGPNANVNISVARTLSARTGCRIYNETVTIPTRCIVIHGPRVVSDYRALAACGFQPDHIFVISARDDVTRHEISGRLEGWYGEIITSFIGDNETLITNIVASLQT